MIIAWTAIRRQTIMKGNDMKTRQGRKAGLSRRSFMTYSLSAAAGLGLSGNEKLFGKLDIKKGGDLKIKEYRTLGRTGFKASDIGLGAGPTNNAEVLEAVLDSGINYIDTAEHYVQGNSERTIGQVMAKRDRKKVFVTTKLNFGLGGSSYKVLKQRALKCLERLQMDYVDCLMIHMTPTAEQVKKESYHKVIQELKTEGKVRFTGLSNHGTEHSMAGPTKDSMEKVVLAAAEDGRFDVVLFVYNFLQKEQGEMILKACKEKNMGTTLMKTNPVKFYSDMETMFKEAEEKGRKIPDAYRKMLEEYKLHAGEAEVFKKKHNLTSPEQIRDAAIKFCLDNPDVHSVCPSINSFEELNSYVALSGERLVTADKAMLADYESAFGTFYCRHACGQCESQCPSSVPVNTIMRYHHYFAAQGREKHAMTKYYNLVRNNASLCSNCSGHCESACPYNVPIQGLLTLAHQTLTLA
jgi:predicted aldo/keto reductase-like oxidoreductase